jgi:flagellar hook-length control protein FliK
MEIKPPTSDLYTAISRSTTATTQNSLPNTVPLNWKVEQLIKAIITQITDKQLFLDIQGVKANTIKPALPDLQIGDTLKLQIEQLKPTPQFRIIGLEKTSNLNLITQIIKNNAPQNVSLTPLLKNISYVANRPSLRPSPLSADVNAAVRNIFKQLPAPFNLKTATQVKNQLQNSGVFIENKIRNQIFSSAQNTPINKNTNLKANLDLDLGAQLHRLANLIRTQLLTPAKNATPLIVKPDQSVAKQINNPVENKIVTQQPNRAATEQATLQNITIREEAMQTFLRQIESSLTHLQQTQLQNLNESQAGRPLWLMELPIKNGQDIDLFELRINEEENTESEDETKKIWNVTLTFNLTGLGKIKAHIKMQNDFISAQFFSENPETLALFNENFDFLRSRLNYNGLSVGDIKCAHAKLTQDILPVNSKRLDERT